MIRCWLDILAYIAIGLTVAAFSFVWYDQRKTINKLRKAHKEQK